MKHRLLKFLALLLAVCTLSLTVLSSTRAQDTNDDVQSLPEILNQQSPPTGNTTADLSRNYYHKCVNEETLVFTSKEQEILCSCTASEMSTLLTSTEIKHLEKKTRTGANARDKFRAHAYAPCMEYVVEDKVRYECMKSKKLSSIIVGKASICKCVTERFKNFVNRNAVDIIMHSVKIDKMILNPLEHYFRNNGYITQRDYTIGQCYAKFRYKKDNR